MPISRATGVDAYYETAGDGPALLLIHALPFDHHLWMYQVARFASWFRTIAIDVRGWGRSGKPHNEFTLRDMCDDALGVLRQEGVDKTVVMGCSVGSKMALMLAVDHPDVVTGAVLVGGNSGKQNQFDHRIAAYRAAKRDGTLAQYHRGHLEHGVSKTFAASPLGRHLLRSFVERDAILDPESIAQVFRALTISDLTPQLPGYRTPTLIVNGEHDGALPGGTKTASLIAHAEHRILPDTGHCCFLEDPAGFEEIVIDFLERNRLMPPRG
jgi:pimeloyl-ACP methyl ester carboxylesterase